MSNTFAPAQPHYVYVINETDMKRGQFICKIGVTKNATQRRKSLQTGNARKLEISNTFHVGNDYNTAKENEAKIQAMFADKQQEGEWFKFNPLTFVQEVEPTIQQFVKDLNVEMPAIPTTAIADIKMPKKMYQTLKLRQITLGKKDSLTLMEEFEAKVISNALAKESNLERRLGEEARDRREAKRKRLAEKKAKEQRAFHYLAYCLK